MANPYTLTAFFYISVMKKLLFLFAFILFSCSSDEEHASFTVVNQKDIITITEISLVGYKFETLSIGLGESKTFVLDKGLNGGYDNVNVSFSWTCGGRGWSGNTTINFLDGQTNRIALIDTFGNNGGGGCRDVGFN